MLTRVIATLGLACAALSCAPEPPPYQRTIYTFGTLASISIYDQPHAEASAAADDIEQALARLNRDWYAWGPGELGELNRSLADKEVVDISLELGELIGQALEFGEASDGLFDPTLGSLVELWGFHDSADEASVAPRAADIRALTEAIPVRVELDSEGARVIASATGVVIDLGGIAKGAALAECQEILARHGVRRALIDLGGDILAMSPANSQPFEIGVQDPRGDGAVAVIAAGRGEAVVTSGDYERFYDQDDERYHHIIDPKTGYPTAATAAVTVIANDPVLADAAATALMVGGIAKFEELTTNLGVELATLITVDGAVVHTEGMQARLQWLDKIDGAGTD